jgi:hypothetical protein
VPWPHYAEIWLPWSPKAALPLLPALVLPPWSRSGKRASVRVSLGKEPGVVSRATTLSPPTHPFPRHKDTQERGDTEKHRRGEVVEPAGAETSHSPTTRTILDVDAPEQAGGAARTRRQGSGHERSTQAAKPWIQTAQP